MKYYQIGITAEPKVMGVANGIHQIEIEKKEMQNDLAFQDFLCFFNRKNTNFWKRQNEVKNFKIPVINAKLLKKAKITDVMGYTENISFLNYVYSDKYISILKPFNIGEYSTFEVAIENVKEKYYMLFIETIGFDKIDFKNSLVITGHKATNNIKYHSVNNHDEYIDFKQKNILGSFEKLAISIENLGKDIICVQSISDPFYSEKLIDLLLDSGITNFQPSYNNSIQLKFI